ncbi:MAG: 4-(cytidine 5'-diphospho)-2-C-methyl-D-erythritol kinase [Gemmatimonadaceae bacterium]|nr:4-(cytidine 5'-diphospho)-2-C-methyl-D-erythritol kinase [Gemmatimonadaceae bacterium]
MSSLAGKTLAQAKINLFLRVLGKGIDGFHVIETLFLRLDIGDDVTVRITDLGRAVDCEGLTGVPPEKNLAYLAAETYAAATGWPRGFSIEISKRIPAGAGMGGGSADAAAVLRILNRISPDPLDDATLLDVSRSVGSDVPFLTSSAVMALAWGRGERLLALAPLTKKPVLIAVPEFAVSTAEAYGRLDRGGAIPTGAQFIPLSDLTSWSSVAASSENDFEAVVGADHPEIPRLISTFKLAGAQISRMTGTGSAVFAIFDAAPAALPMMNSKVSLLTTLTSSSVVPVTVLD